MSKILIIDDDIELCELLTEYLSAEGFTVTSVHHGNKGLKQLRDASYDLVILDVMLPQLNGFDVLRKMREFSTLPVLMLTARGDDIDRIVGLEMGADDYLPKPFNPRELVVRLKAILRRTQAQTTGKSTNRLKQLTVDDITIDLEKRTAKVNNKAIVLTNTEYNILLYLLESADKAVPKEVLYEKTLGRKMEPFDRSLDVHVSNLRNKVGPNKKNKSRIKTLHGYGYLYETNNA